MIETLLKPIQGVAGCRCQLDVLCQLLIQLCLKYPRIHEHLDGIGVKQKLVGPNLATEVLNLCELHGRLTEVEHLLRKV